MSSIKPYKVGCCYVCRQEGDRSDKPLIGNLCYTAEPFHYQKHQEEKTAGYIENETEKKREKHLAGNLKSFSQYRSRSIYIELPGGETGNLPELPKPKGIRKVSKKREAELRQYEINKAEYLKEKSVCEFPGCHCTDVTLHHKKGRIGSLLTDKRYFCSLCLEHHRLVELNPEMAKEMKLSLSRLDK